MGLAEPFWFIKYNKMKKIILILVILAFQFNLRAQYFSEYNSEPDRCRNLFNGMIVGEVSFDLAYYVFDQPFTKSWLISGGTGFVYAVGAEFYDMDRYEVEWSPCHIAMRFAGSWVPGMTRELLDLKKKKDKINTASNFLYRGHSLKKQARLQRRYLALNN